MRCVRTGWVLCRLRATYVVERQHRQAYIFLPQLQRGCNPSTSANLISRGLEEVLGLGLWGAGWVRTTQETHRKLTGMRQGCDPGRGSLPTQ